MQTLRGRSCQSSRPDEQGLANRGNHAPSSMVPWDRMRSVRRRVSRVEWRPDRGLRVPCHVATRRRVFRAGLRGALQAPGIRGWRSCSGRPDWLFFPANRRRGAPTSIASPRGNTPRASAARRGRGRERGAGTGLWPRFRFVVACTGPAQRDGCLPSRIARLRTRGPGGAPPRTAVWQSGTARLGW